LWFFAAGLCRERSHNPGNASRRVPRSSRVLPGRTWPHRTAEAAKHGTSPELRFPSAHVRPEDPHSRAYLTRFGPSSGFDYPLDGFRPSGPGRPCFMPTALLGFVTPFGAFPFQKVPKAITPCRRTCVPFLRPLRPHLPKQMQTGPADRGFQALTLPEVPRPTLRVNASPSRMLPWALPSPGFSRRSLGPASTGPPPTRFLLRR
jgi:hypothetical protein